MKIFLNTKDEDVIEASTDRIRVHAKYHNVIIHENPEGIIVDVYGENDLITTETYWDDDQIEALYGLC